MLRAPDVDGSDVELRSRLTRGEQFLQRADLRVGLSNDREREERERGYRSEILHWIERHGLEQRYAYRGTVANEKKRVAIRFRLRDGRRGADASRTRLVL